MNQPMNRETKRLLKKQGSLAADGSAVVRERTSSAPAAVQERTPPLEFFRQVRAELRKVVWPTRPEIINFTSVTVVMLLLVTVVVFFLDLLASKGVYGLFR
jgi:preprotein translocase subunit SecE